MKRIHYNPQVIRRVAGECKEEAFNIDTSRSKMMELMKNNNGMMRQKMDRIIISAQDCMRNTQNLLNEASNFMTQLAKHLENQDNEIARKMGE